MRVFPQLLFYKSHTENLITVSDCIGYSTYEVMILDSGMTESLLLSKFNLNRRKIVTGYNHGGKNTQKDLLWVGFSTGNW